MTEPAAVVDAQVDAYRKRDLELFLSFYSEAVVILGPDGQLVMSGLAELRAQYGRFFADNPGLSIEVASRISIGEFVIDEEVVRSEAPDAIAGEPRQMRAVAVYRVAGGHIIQVTMLR